MYTFWVPNNIGLYWKSWEPETGVKNVAYFLSRTCCFFFFAATMLQAVYTSSGNRNGWLLSWI